MGKSSSPPPAPDPVATANAQSGYDKATAGYNAALNRYDVNTPLGSLNWSQNGTDPATGAPIYSQQVNLNPTSQATLNQTQGNALNLAQTQGQMLGNASAGMASPVDTTKLPGMQSSVNYNGPGYAGPVAQGDLTGLANKATNAAYGSSMALLQPQMDIDRKAMTQQLANQGIPVGSENYNNQMGTMNRSQDFTRTQAANNATLTGMQYDNQLFNQGLNNANLQNDAQQGGYNQALSSGGFANSAQAQAMQQYLGLRQEPLNEYNAMMNGTQVQTPQFQATPAVSAQAPNYAQAVQNNYQGQLNAFNTQTGSSNSMTSGLMGIAAAAAYAF